MRDKRTSIELRDSGEATTKYRIGTLVYNEPLAKGIGVQLMVDIHGLRPLTCSHFVSEEQLQDGDVTKLVHRLVHAMVAEISQEISRCVGLADSIADDLKTILKIRNIAA